MKDKQLIFRTGLIFTILVATAMLVAGCNLFLGLFETGTLKLSLADSPIDAQNVDGVWITITEIQYHKNDKWVTMEEYKGGKYNLLELTGGNSTLLGELRLTAGEYNQIRFMLDAPERGSQTPSNPGCYISFTDGTTEALFVPSGSETGYKAVGAFTVPENGEVSVTADFDVRKSVVEAGVSGIYILKPTIRLVVDDQAGKITGTVTYNGTNEIIIYAYEDGSWADTEDDDPATEESRFPDAVVSGKVNDDDSYALPYLAGGTYDLVVTEYSGSDFVSTLGFVSDVAVESGKTTSQDIDTANLDSSP
ncbi:MAG: DUF4382 domain-containing protein [Spirochaetes bacterium]|nr:MAG: DUF4382 domain-containing protein [Spirochaetota bacterium]